MRESIRNEIVRLHYGGRLTAPHCKTAGDRSAGAAWLACWRITNNTGLVQWNSRARDGRAYWDPFADHIAQLLERYPEPNGSSPA